jgi:predicted DsbA family dithiol-disulfide isomerase
MENQEIPNQDQEMASRSAKKRSQVGYFKNKYYSDPEYRKKHLEKITKPVLCECGITTNITYIKRHKNTQKHKAIMNALEKLKN